MRWLLIFLIATPCMAVCNPTSTAGCPGSWAGTHGSTTFTAIAGTGYTNNGVTTASIDDIWGIEYNHSVCPYAAPSGGNQSSCDIAWIGPHEAEAAGSGYQMIFVYHGGGSVSGGYAASDPWGTSILTNSILMVQDYLGVPNAVGGTGIVIVLVNYRLTLGSGSFGTNSWPAQWQDVKCSLWHVLANASTFPGNKNLIGLYGSSWGGTLAYWAAETSDTAYTTSCDSSAPGTDPQYRVAAAWPALAWLYPFGNGSFDNVTQTQAYKNAIIGQMNSATEATIQTNCAALTPTCDAVNNISSSNLAVYQNAPVMFEFGSYGNSCATADCLVMPYWNTLGVTTGTTGGAPGGNLYNLAVGYDTTPLRPFMQILSPNCFHVCDTTTSNAPSEIDAMNFLLRTANRGSGGLGGTMQ